MRTPVIRRSLGIRKTALIAVIAAAELLLVNRLGFAGLGPRHLDPAQVVPLEQLVPESRDAVAEVIRDHTFHRQGEPDTFPCNGNLYLSLLNEPIVPLTLWKDLSDSPAQLQKVGPNRYEGTDGTGSRAVWDFVLRSPRMHVLLAYFNYVSPHGSARVDARIVLIVRFDLSHRRQEGATCRARCGSLRQDRLQGLEGAARSVRPVIERILEDQVREAGFFISLMSRLVISYPNWACQVVGSQQAIDAGTKQRFQELVVQSKKPGASTGRPIVMQNPPPGQEVRRR